jgi:hypothetical protein
MHLRLLLFLMSAASATGQVHDVQYRGFLTPLNITPTFDHGYLVVYDWDHKVDVFDPDGALMYSAAVKVSGSDWALIENGAVDADGTMAAAIGVVSAAGILRSGGIALFDRTGAQIRLMNTAGYFPTQIAFGPDHSIWTIGRLGDQPGDATADYSILRNYARDGTASGEFLRRSSFPYAKDPPSQPLIASMLGLWELRVANERLEIFLHQAHLWVEADLQGKETGRWAAARPTAVTQNGKAWRVDGPRLKVFDRVAGVWNAVAFEVPDGGLLGAEGDSLVFLLHGQNTLRWAPAPESAPSQPPAAASKRLPF